MPFRLWFYAVKAALPLMLAPVAVRLFWGWDNVPAAMDVATFVPLTVLAMTGAVMGVLMVMGRLRMRCPFCGRSGPAGGNRAMGLFMLCENCGLIRGGGMLNMRVVRDNDSQDTQS